MNAVHTRWRPVEPITSHTQELQSCTPQPSGKLCEALELDSSKLVLLNSGFESLGKFVFSYPTLNKVIVDH